jgi:hypothetical protein
MDDSLVHALASTPRLQNAMTQTTGNLGRMRPRASKRDFFRASRTNCGSTSRIGPAAELVRGSCHPGSVRDSLHWAGSASLRSEQTKSQNQRGGNDARRKAWKTQTLSFPPSPPRLEIRQKAPDSHITTASTAATSPYLTLSRAPPLPTAFVDGCRSLRSRSIRQRRFAPMVTGIASNR